MVGLVVLELLAQVCASSVEALVAPTTQVYFGWTLDASAVLLLAISAAGVVGLGAAESLRPRLGVRRTLLACGASVAASFAACIPWGGSLFTWQYCGGCVACAFAFVPMSTFATRVFAAGAAKFHGPEHEVRWTILLWKATSFPARILTPIAIGFLMSLNQGAAPNYISLVVFTLVCLVVFANAPSSQADWAAAGEHVHGLEGRGCRRRG